MLNSLGRRVEIKSRAFTPQGLSYSNTLLR